jgi:prepilin-type N-terminal cleavage/methylation domain-containing protein
MSTFQRNSYKRGFTLVEIMIALAIFGSALTVVLYYQQRASVLSRATDTSRALTTMISKIKTYYGASNTYSGLAATGISQLGIAPSPLSTTSTTVVDPWGNTMTFTAGSTSFVVELGGASAIDPEACGAIATAFANNATAIYVGTGYTTTAGVLAGATAATGIYKTSAGVITSANLGAGCSQTGTKVALQIS